MASKYTESLLSLIQGDDGRKWAQSRYGWKEEDENVCSWDGVNCDPTDRETIVGLVLTDSEFKGTLPSELGTIISLKEIIMPNNEVFGTIPNLIAELPHLEKFHVASNSITGTLPNFKSPKLVSFDVSYNNLSGTLQSDIGSLHDRMENFDVTSNRLAGAIPDSFRLMTALKALSLSTNEFSGTIPQSIGYCRVLSYLYLDNNYLMGTIPPSLSKLGASMKELWLHENLLSGTIPNTISELKNMFNFYIDGNKFTGTIPKELCREDLNADFFDGVDESKRDYCDSIACPAGSVAENGMYPCHECPNRYLNPYLGGEVGHCIELEQHDILHILYNDMGGENWHDITLEWKPENDYYCSYTGVSCDNNNNVIGIDLKSKGLTGTIPEAIGYLRFLEHIDLSDNHLTGYLPSDLRWAPLQRLDISGNQLKGIVAPSLCEKEGINSNGDNGKFDCEVIACPVGYYSPTGVGGNGADRCKPCDGNAPYLASKTCTKKNGKYASHHLIWGEQQRGNAPHHSESEEFSVVIMGLLVIGVGLALIAHAYRKWKESIGKEETTRLYEDVLKEVEEDDMDQFDIN